MLLPNRPAGIAPHGRLRPEVRPIIEAGNPQSPHAAINTANWCCGHKRDCSQYLGPTNLLPALRFSLTRSTRPGLLAFAARISSHFPNELGRPGPWASWNQTSLNPVPILHGGRPAFPFDTSMRTPIAPLPAPPRFAQNPASAARVRARTLTSRWSTTHAVPRNGPKHEPPHPVGLPNAAPLPPRPLGQDAAVCPSNPPSGRALNGPPLHSTRGGRQTHDGAIPEPPTRSSPSPTSRACKKANPLDRPRKVSQSLCRMIAYDGT